MIEAKDFRSRTEQIEQLVQRANSLENGDARAIVQELLQAVMDLHGTVLARVVELIVSRGTEGEALLAELARDPHVAGLLLLYDLHPDDAATRVARVVEALRPQIEKHGGSVELIAVTRDEARVAANLHGCSAETTKTSIEQAIFDAAPEISTVVIEPVSNMAGGFVPLGSVHRAA